MKLQCKNCGKDILKNRIGRFCGYTCKNIFYKINERNLKGRRNQIESIALSFVSYYYHGIVLRSYKTNWRALKLVPYLMNNQKFKTEIDKLCTK